MPIRTPPYSIFRLQKYMPNWATQGDWERGMVGDAPRTGLAEGGVFNSIDFLLHEPRMIMKRAGTSYAGPAMTSATDARALIYADYTAGSQLLAVGNNGHLYKITSG